MVLDPIPQSLPVHFFGSRPQPPTSRKSSIEHPVAEMCVLQCGVVVRVLLQCVVAVGMNGELSTLWTDCTCGGVARCNVFSDTDSQKSFL